MPEARLETPNGKLSPTTYYKLHLSLSLSLSLSCALECSLVEVLHRLVQIQYQVLKSEQSLSKSNIYQEQNISDLQKSSVKP